MPPRFMNGVPELLLLRLLADQESYGYELAQALQAITSDHLTLGEGSIYTTLHTLEARRLVKSRSATHDGRRRVYYTLTPRGRRRLARAAAEWRRVQTAVDGVLEWGLDGAPS